MKRRLLSVQQWLALLLVVFGFWTLAALVSRTGEIYALHQKVAVLEQRKAALEGEVEDLEAEIAAAGEPGWIEMAARKWLHWIPPDETLIVIPASALEVPSPQPRTNTLVSGAVAHWEEWRDYLLGVKP